MSLNEEYETVNRKIDLIDYIYYLQYEMQVDDICVETIEAAFMVWEGSTFKVNGEESTTDEFYEMLASISHQVTCNGEPFECIDGKFVSLNLIAIKIEKVSNIIQF